MDKVKQKLRKDFKKYINLEALDFIENETDLLLEQQYIENSELRNDKEYIDNYKSKYEEEYRENIKKYILGKFNTEGSKSFLINYLNELFKKNKKDIDVIKTISNFFKETMIFPEIEIILKLIKENNNLYNCLERIFKKNEEKILEDKMYEILDDDIFLQFMEVFLDLKGIVIETNLETDYLNAFHLLDSTKAFIIQISKYPVLTKEEEANLFKTLEEGDIKAKKQIAEHNLKLVVSIAKRYLYTGREFNDIIQDGTLGLMKSIEKFDYKKGYKFSTFSTWWIRQSITRELANTNSAIRLPVHIQNGKNKFNIEYQKITNELGREPTKKELKELTSYSKEEIDIFLELPTASKSLNSKIDDEDANEIGDFIPDLEKNTESEGTKIILKQEISELLDRAHLKEREKEIIILRFGLDGKGEKTLEEVGKIFGVTRERIRQLEEKIMKKLRNLKNIKTFALYMDKPERASRFIDECRDDQIKKCLDKADARNKEQIKIQEKKIDIKESKKMRKRSQKNLYIYFSDEYTEQELDIVFNELSSKDKEALKRKYGEDLKNPTPQPSMNPIEHNQFAGVLQKIKRHLKKNKEKAAKNNKLVSNIKLEESTAVEKPLIKLEEKPNEKNIVNKTKIEVNQQPSNDKIIKKNNLIETTYMNLIKEISIRESIIVSLKLGFINGICYSANQIAEFLALEEEEVITTCKNIINKLQERLNVLIEKDEEIKESTQSETFMDMINNMHIIESTIVSLKLGFINGKNYSSIEIAEFLNMNTKTVIKISETNINMLQQKLNSIKESDKIYAK